MDLYVFLVLVLGVGACLAAAFIGSRQARQSGRLSRLQAAGQIGLNLLVRGLLVCLFNIVVFRVFQQNIDGWANIAFVAATIILSGVLMPKANRALLAFALGRIDEVECCVRSLKDTPQLTERVAAIQVLGLRGDGRAIRPLENALRDEAAEVREAAAAALGDIDNRQTEKPKRPEEFSGTTRKIALAVKAWSRERAGHWWAENSHRHSDAVCDACSRPVGKDEGYLLAGWIRCEGCLNNSLCGLDWRFLLSGAERTEIIGKIRRALDPIMPETILGTMTS